MTPDTLGPDRIDRELGSGGMGNVYAATAATHLARGSLRAAARDLAAEQGFPVQETPARGELASLPGGDAADALAACTENDERLDAGERRNARWLLFRATGDRAHLEEAKRLLDESVAHVDGSTRESMLTDLRLNREIRPRGTRSPAGAGSATTRTCPRRRWADGRSRNAPARAGTEPRPFTGQRLTTRSVDRSCLHGRGLDPSPARVETVRHVTWLLAVLNG